MKIFTKMKRMMLMAVAVLCTNAAFAQDAEYSAVWMNDFEDANTFSEGFVSGNTGRYEVLQKTGYKDGSKSVSFSPIGNGNNGTTNTFTPNATLASAFENFKDDYIFDFYYYQQAGNNQGDAGIEIIFKGGSIVSILAPKGSSAYIKINGTKVGSDIPNKTWCHIFIKVKESQTSLTILSVDGNTTYVDNATIANSVDAISKINNMSFPEKG